MRSALASGLSLTAFINGKNAATIGTGGTHGGVVVGGSGTVIIGDTHSPCEFVPPAPLAGHARWIGFVAGEAVASSLDEELEEFTHWDIF